MKTKDKTKQSKTKQKKENKSNTPPPTRTTETTTKELIYRAEKIFFLGTLGTFICVVIMYGYHFIIFACIVWQLMKNGI